MASEVKQRLSRREFLRLAAVAGVGAAVPGVTNVFAKMSAVPPAQEAVTIKWWDFPRGWAPPGSAENPNAWNEETVTRYMEVEPNVTIEFTGVSWSDGPQKLDIALAAFEGPDVMYGYPALFGKMLSLGVLYPIDDFLALMDPESVDDFFPPALEFVSAEGQKWAWPWYYSSEGEWAVNLTVAEEAGTGDLVPKAPTYGWTPDEFLAFAQANTFTRDNGEQVWGVFLHANEQQGINLWPYWSFAYMFGAKLYDEAERMSSFGDEAGVQAFQFMYDLVEEHAVAPPGTAGLTPDNLNELWNRKQLATRCSSGVELLKGIEAAIEAGTIEPPFEIQPVLPPTLEGLPVRTSGAVGVQMVFYNEDDPRLNAAMTFAQWLTNAENMEILGFLTPLTARRSTTEKLAADDPWTQWRVEYVLPTMASYSKAPEDLKIDDAWMQALQSMFVGERTPAEAAQWFEDEANKLLQGM